MNADSKLTVLLTLKDRALFTRRWMAYANSIGFPFKVLIADGGEDKSIEQELASGSSYTRVDYEYVRYPYDETYSQYYDKLYNAISRISTPFVVMADNDDFYFIEGIQKSVEFLEGNIEYATCRGVSGGFIIDSMRSHPGQGEVYGDNIQLVISSEAPSITTDDPLERVDKHFGHYSPTFYDVHRTEDLKQSYEHLKSLAPDNVLIAELLTSFLTVAKGKVYRGDYLYLIRQRVTSGNNSKLDRKKSGDYFNRMLADTWSDDFTGFTDIVSRAIAVDPNVTNSEAKDQVKQGFRKYAAPMITASLARDLGMKSRSPITKLRDRVVNRPLKSKTRRAAKWVYKSCRSCRESLLKVLWRRRVGGEMSLDNPSNYRDQLLPIYHFLSKLYVESQDKSGTLMEVTKE